MRGKKFFFIFILAAVFAVGWLLTLRAASGIEERREQEELTAQAELFLERGQYVRGIPLLEEALSIKTDGADEQRAEIQKKLLKAYADYGDMESYETLLVQMECAQIAQPENYVTLAEYQVQQGDLESMLKTVQTGLQYHADEKLETLYEENRYACTISLTGYEQLQLLAGTAWMPAFDGEWWCYTDVYGKVVLSDDYEEAAAFNQNGYGVVKKDGAYRVILQNGDLYGVDDTGVEEVYALTSNAVIAKKDGQYGYYSYDFELLSEELLFEDITRSSNGVSAVKRNGKWGIFSTSEGMVTDFIYEDVAINSQGAAFAAERAMVKQGGKWMLVDCAGNALTDAVFVKAKAPESDGWIAVADASEKWGYIDENGNRMIDYQYWDAKSFSCDVAAVCTANHWGYISMKNVLVIEARYLDAEPFQNGRAAASTVEGAAILQMKYYDILFVD